MRPRNAPAIAKNGFDVDGRQRRQVRELAEHAGVGRVEHHPANRREDGHDVGRVGRDDAVDPASAQQHVREVAHVRMGDRSGRPRDTFDRGEDIHDSGAGAGENRAPLLPDPMEKKGRPGRNRDALSKACDGR